MQEDSTKLEFEVIHSLLMQADDLLNEAVERIIPLDYQDKKDTIREIGMAFGSIAAARIQIPGYVPQINTEIPELDEILSDEEISQLASFSESDLQAIDNALLAKCDVVYRKVARVVGTMMMEDPDRIVGVPDLFYADRVVKLIKAGRLEYQGMLGAMRFCEVRLPSDLKELQ